MNTISNRQKAECAEREVKQRMRVYRRLMAEGRLSPNTARREIAIMQAIANDYRKLAEKDEPPLFVKEDV